MLLRALANQCNGTTWSLPLATLVLVAVSYFTRAPNGRLVANVFGVAGP